MISTTVFGQSDFRFHRYNLANGLPSPDIRDIAEDSYGFIWFATGDGLARFDGYNFRVFRNVGGTHPDLTSNEITSIFPLDDGNLLVGTAVGLHYFDRRKQAFRNTWGTLPYSYISKIIKDGKTGFWVSSSTGLYHLAEVGQVPEAYINDERSPLYSTGIFDLHLDSENQLWITTSRKGFFKLSLKSRELVNYRNNPDDPASLSSNTLRQLVPLGDGRLVIGTSDQGYNIFDPQTEKFTRYKHDPSNRESFASTSAFSLLVDSNKNLWIGSWANGLNFINTKTWSDKNFQTNPDNKYSVCSNSIISLLESSTGDIWIGSSTGGVSRFTPAEQKFSRYYHEGANKNSLTNSYVRSIYEDDEGIIWFGTAQGGLNRFDPSTNSYRVYLKPDESPESLSRGTIWSISEGVDGTLWLATSRGVAKMNKKTGASSFVGYDVNAPKKLSGNNVLKVLDDRRGSVWIGVYYGGLNRLDTKTGIVEKFMADSNDPNSISGNNVNDIFIDSKNRIWVACEDALNLFNRDTKTFTHFLKSKEDASILQVNEYPNGQLYLATANGLTIFDPETGKSTVVSEAEGLSSNHANSVLIDDSGFVWVGTNSGIDRYDPRSGETLHLDESDGLCANDTEGRSAFKTKKGTIYFGGTDGATAFNPANVFTDHSIPKVVFTGLSIFNKQVAVSDSTVLKQSLHTTNNITLQYSDYVFALEFAALRFDLPNKIRYAYKLEGFDKDWIYTDANDRKAVYTNVPHGSYKLNVRASNTEGKFGEEFTSLSITVVPPWWKTWWAQVLFYGSALLLLAGGIRARFAFIKQQNKLLEQQVAERTAEVIEQKEELEVQAKQLEKANLQKNKLFSIIAHDLKSPVNSLSGMLELLDPKILTSADLDSMKGEMSQRLDGISGAMDNLLGWASGQLEGETLRFEIVDPGTVIREMLELYTPIAAKKKIALQAETNHTRKVNVDINLLRAVMRNLTNNAIKFTEPGGVVTLTTQEVDGQLITSVKDSGVGMSPEQVKNVFSSNRRSTTGTSGERGVGLGLQLVNDFINKLDGKLWVESQPGEGTAFFFSLKSEPKSETSTVTLNPNWKR
jgi:signal transduction histidine kinase/ligand-binding sensor domain-containing protein